MNERLRRLPTYPMVQLEQRKDALRARGVPIFDFGTGDPTEPTPSAIRAAFERGMPAVSQYPRIDGLSPMRRAAAGYLQRRFGVEIDPDRELLPTQGSKEAIFHLPMLLLDPTTARNRVVYGTPAYPVFELGALFAQAEPHEIVLHPGNRYLLDPDEVGAEVLDRTGVVFLNYPHNRPASACPASCTRAGSRRGRGTASCWSATSATPTSTSATPRGRCSSSAARAAWSCTRCRSARA